MKVNRRDFLKIGGGAGVAVALGGGFYRWSQISSSRKKDLNPRVSKDGSLLSAANVYQGAVSW